MACARNQRHGKLVTQPGARGAWLLRPTQRYGPVTRSIEHPGLGVERKSCHVHLWWLRLCGKQEPSDLDPKKRGEEGKMLWWRFLGQSEPRQPPRGSSYRRIPSPSTINAQRPPPPPHGYKCAWWQSQGEPGGWKSRKPGRWGRGIGLRLGTQPVRTCRIFRQGSCFNVNPLPTLLPSDGNRIFGTVASSPRAGSPTGSSAVSVGTV